MPQSRTTLTSFRSKLAPSDLDIIQGVCEAVTTKTSPSRTTEDVLLASWQEAVESAIFTSIGKATSHCSPSTRSNEPIPWSKLILGSILSSKCDLKSDIECYRSELANKNSIRATLKKMFGKPTNVESKAHTFTSQVVSNILRY